MSAYPHATALISSAGVSAAEFLPCATHNFDAMSYRLTEAAGEIDEGRYPGELATVTTMGRPQITSSQPAGTPASTSTCRARSRQSA